MDKKHKVKKKKTKVKEEDYSKSFNDLMSVNGGSVIVPVEWREHGDMIEKYSIYDEYSPVITSGSSTYC